MEEQRLEQGQVQQLSNRQSGIEVTADEEISANARESDFELAQGIDPRWGHAVQAVAKGYTWMLVNRL